MQTRVVQGFLRRDGQRLVNDAGPVFLQGWGIGNWLLPEGYMWASGGAANFDRPRRIQARVQELLGASEAQAFWQAFRAQFFTQADVQYIKAQGYNHIRLPFDASLFLADEPGVHFTEGGFSYLQQVVDWCREADLYVFFDMHAAPGGQTGANIDNAIDSIPRLFIDQHQYDRGVALWQEIARRFADEPVVAGFDLLNEPIRPQTGDLVDYDYLLPRLAAFYRDAIAAIRQVDTAHLVALEGFHWASDTKVFTHRFDANMCVHFHRYAGFPEAGAFRQWFALQQRLDVPLWLGETGENKPQWYTALAQMCRVHNIGYTFWPYKKMGKHNGSVTVPAPAGWDAVIRYVQGGLHPGYKQAQATFDELLNNMTLAHCTRNQAVDRAILRHAPLVMRASDYLDDATSANEWPKNFEAYRSDTPMQVVAVATPQPSAFTFDSHWDRFVVVLHPGDTLAYLTPAHAHPWTLKVIVKGTGTIKATIGDTTVEAVCQNGEARFTLPANGQDERLMLIGGQGAPALEAIAF